MANDPGDCFVDDNARRVDGCTEMIARPDLPATVRSLAYATRALSYALRGQYQLALADYDSAIDLDPGSAIAFNNRAWVMLKLGRTERGLRDVERALALAPYSSYAYDTRAHLLQVRGALEEAHADYERAIRLGGERTIKLYQCGLQAQGLLSGAIDGLYTADMHMALKTCVRTKGCDPLPPDEECRKLTS